MCKGLNEAPGKKIGFTVKEKEPAKKRFPSLCASFDFKARTVFNEDPFLDIDGKTGYFYDRFWL